MQTTEQLLQTISAMSSSGQTSGSTGVSVSTYGVSSVSLRGLGEERTLVLLNGRRMAPFRQRRRGTVNVNNIPLAAIERVEILKDGASAIYGSDAVAGVVNFILTKNFQGYQIGGTYGTPTQSGGGQQYMANIVAGWGDQTKDNWNLTVSGQYAEEPDAVRPRTASTRRPTTTSRRYCAAAATGQGNIQGAWQPGRWSHDPAGRGLPFPVAGSGYRQPAGRAAANAARSRCR